MHMPEGFKQRLFPRLPKIVDYYGTPFHILDETGIIETGRELKRLFQGIRGFQEFFAVKACPLREVLRIMYRLGFGFDCSSITELQLARQVGATPDRIMFTSNNTSQEEYEEAAKDGGCILNLDDITFVKKVPKPFPELICFRYNPGEGRTGTSFIGNPPEAKYGVRYDQIFKAYELAKRRGAKRFGLHTMLVSNQLDYTYVVETIKMLLELTEEIAASLGILLRFINIGGGFGIPYKPEDKPFDMAALAQETKRSLAEFYRRWDYVPDLYMESGRYMTGPHGVLVTTCINRMSKHKEYVGVNACTNANPRPPRYGAHHGIEVINKNGRPKKGRTEVVDVVGSLCENSDKFAIDRPLPKVREGDHLKQENTGAHSLAMGDNYNFRTLPQILLLRQNGDIDMIQRAETPEDLLRTQTDFEPKILKA